MLTRSTQILLDRVIEPRIILRLIRQRIIRPLTPPKHTRQIRIPKPNQPLRHIIPRPIRLIHHGKLRVLHGDIPQRHGIRSGEPAGVLAVAVGDVEVVGVVEGVEGGGGGGFEGEGSEVAGGGGDDGVVDVDAGEVAALDPEVRAEGKRRASGVRRQRFIKLGPYWRDSPSSIERDEELLIPDRDIQGVSKRMMSV